MIKRSLLLLMALAIIFGGSPARANSRWGTMVWGQDNWFIPATMGGTFTTNGAVNDNATIAPFIGVTVAAGDNVSVAIAYTAANGTLSGPGLTGTAGSYTLTAAAPATVTSNLQGLIFTPTANQVAPGLTVVTSFTLTLSDPTGPVATDSRTTVTATSINNAPINSALPDISGTAKVGNLLTASSGTWSDVDPGASLSYSYQWFQANDSVGTGEVAIDGATGNSYPLTSSAAHKYLRVVVTANDGQGSSNQSASSSWIAILNSVPTLGGTFTINGIANDNATILLFGGVTVSDVDGDNVSVAISYPAANGTITGPGLTGTAGSYTLAMATPATVTGNLQGLLFHPTTHQVPPGQIARTNFTIVPTDSWNSSGTPDSSTWVFAISNNVSPVFTGTPVITGNPVVGQTLGLSNTGVSDADGDTVTLSYQWQANGADIFGATQATYKLTAAELGKSVTCTLVADDGWGVSNSKTSFTTAGVTVQPASPYPPDLIGAYDNGHWYLDTSNNGQWEWGSDFYGYFGSAAMAPVVGDWTGNGHTKIGAYQNGTWYFDLNGNGLWDGEPTDRMVTTFGYPGTIPVAGDWNGDGVAEIGVYDPNTFAWYLDYDGNFSYNPAVDVTAYFGFAGCLPVVGDWNGDGRDKIGVYTNGEWYLDANGNYAWDGTPTDTMVVNYGFLGMLPLTGDWTGSGVARIGGYYNGDWYLDIDGNGVWNPPTDKYLGPFGAPGMIPVVGHW